ncbi:hypothetical protein BGX27_004218, partial [Mortierella sp. AM989]
SFGVVGVYIFGKRLKAKFSEKYKSGQDLSFGETEGNLSRRIENLENILNEYFLDMKLFDQVIPTKKKAGG